MVEKLKRPDSDTEKAWCGFTRDKSLLPLEEIEADGYILELREDLRGQYWEIIKGNGKRK